jgi:hypothetical protein
MAKKIKGPQMILANYLDDGRVVFFTKAGDWSADTSLAAYGEGEALEALTAEANKSVGDNTVAGIELIPARVEGDIAYPAHIKHAMQAKGPSVREDLGYQTSLDWEAA